MPEHKSEAGEDEPFYDICYQHLKHKVLEAKRARRTEFLDYNPDPTAPVVPEKIKPHASLMSIAHTNAHGMADPSPPHPSQCAWER